MTDPSAPLAAIERLPLALAMRHDLWLYPVVEIIHITGFVTLIGSIIVLDLRLLGLSKALPVRLLARHVLPWSFGALLLIGEAKARLARAVEKYADREVLDRMQKNVDSLQATRAHIVCEMRRQNKVSAQAQAAE